MKNHYFHLSFMLAIGGAVIPHLGFSQVYNAGNLYVASAANVYINDSFAHASTAVYQNDGALTLQGNFINNSTGLSGTGTTTFSGTTNQLVEGTQTSVFGNAVVQNANTVKLLQNATVTGSINIGSTNYVDINGNTLAVSNGFTGTGKLKGSATSNLTAGGTGSIYFNHADYYLKNFTVNSGATLSLADSLNIVPGTGFGTLVSNGSLSSSGYLTLKSDANGTARAGQSTGTVTGDVTVERYIPPRRAWRFLAVPFKTSSQTLRDAWQEGVNNTDPSLNYANNQNPKPGFGMHITGDNNTSLGYDYNTTINPSVKTWIQSSKSWTSTTPPTISTNITAYPAYCVFVRGSRAVNLANATGASTDPTVLRARGVLSFGSTTKNYSANTGEFVFIGNPYASSIDIAGFIANTANIQQNKFWVWDPALNGSYSVGGYVTYDNGMMAPQTGSYPVPTTIIQGGQAFFVTAAGSSVAATFNEADKVASETNIFGFAPNNQVVQAKINPKVYINLMVPSGDSLMLIDGVGAMYGSQFSDSFDYNDANKMYTFNENIMLMRQGTRLAIETRNLPLKTDTLFMRMLFLKQQTYTLQTKPENVPSSVKEAWLIDNYLQTQYSLSLTDKTNYSFAATSDTNTYMSRFRIVFTVERKTNNSSIAARSTTNSLTGNISVTPNPITDKHFTVNFSGVEKGSYELDLYNPAGNLILRKQINHAGNTATYPVMLLQDLSHGIYNISIINTQNHQSSNIPVMIGR